MYIINKKFKVKKKLKIKGVSEISGFPMASKNKKFVINGQSVSNISVCNKKLAHPLVSDKVLKKYKKLISLLTKLLLSDDDTGEAFNLILNEIEKFRQEIKNKYRDFLDKKELEYMAKQLTVIQKEAKNKYSELYFNFNNINTVGKSR